MPLVQAPILFLDFDDVLCLNKQFGGQDVIDAFVVAKKNPLIGLDFYPELWELIFDAAAVARLKAVAEEFNPQFVLSTTWRKHFRKDELIEILHRTGCAFVANNLHEDWRTPSRMSETARIHDISSWLQNNPECEDNWVALDDTSSGSSFKHWGPERRAFGVLCQEYVGFLDPEAAALRNALARRRTEQQILC